jgi:hypothetical protein
MISDIMLNATTEMAKHAYILGHHRPPKEEVHNTLGKHVVCAVPGGELRLIRFPGTRLTMSISMIKRYAARQGTSCMPNSGMH